MGRERAAEEYDAGYASNKWYRGDVDQAPWAQLWYWVLARTGEQPIADFGCGAGHLAELLYRRGHPAHLYVGVDFSEEALRQARERAPGYRFVCDSLPAAVSRIRYWDGTSVAVFCEVLEHVTDDKAAIRRVPAGARILATVPPYDSEGHVRHFRTMKAVCARYEGLIRFRAIERIGRIFAFDGVRTKKGGAAALSP